MVNYYISGWIIFLLIPFSYGQNQTDVSLFLRETPQTYLSEIASASGDMYLTVGHHGPAIENEYLGLRMYYNNNGGIDLYSKVTKQLELRGSGWYSTKAQQAKGWGADCYHVGDTVGIGGIRLWDGKQVITLAAKGGRVARVEKEGSVSFLEMISKGIAYREKKIDMLVRVTVYSGVRHGKVEAFCLSGDAVQFVTGLNYPKGQAAQLKQQYALTWGISAGKMAGKQVAVGAAVIFNPDNIVQRIEIDNQALIISKPMRKMAYWITAANAGEAVINTEAAFIRLVEEDFTDHGGWQKDEASAK